MEKSEAQFNSDVCQRTQTEQTWSPGGSNSIHPGFSQKNAVDTQTVLKGLNRNHREAKTTVREQSTGKISQSEASKRQGEC